MQGALDRSDIYKSVEVSLDRSISEHLGHVLAAAREIRKAEIGEEAAKEEQRRGDIPDEEYNRETAVRREVRERQRKQDEARKRREEEKERLRLEAKQKEEELQRLRKLDERMKERQAREKRKEEERKRQAEGNDERRKLYEKRRAEETEQRHTSVRPREQSRSRQTAQDGAKEASTHASRQNMQEAETSTDPQQIIDPEKIIDPETDKALEETALDLLLRESRELAAKSSTKARPERSGSLEPPHRKSHALKPRSSNISPSKIDRRQPARSDSVKPVLSFSSTNTNPRGAIPSQRLRSKSPASAHHAHSVARSPSQSHSHQEDYPSRTNASERRPLHDSTEHQQRGQTSRYYDHSQEFNYHNYSFSRQDTREKDRGRSYSVDESHDSKQQGRYLQRDYDDRDHRSSRRDRSHHDRDRERTRDYDAKYRRDRRDGHRERSRSPLKVSDNQSRHNVGNAAKVEMDIDRYTPNTSIRSKDHGKDRHGYEVGAEQHRDRSSRTYDKYEERYRDSRDDRARDKEPRTGDRDRDRDRGRDYNRYRERHDDKDRDTEKERYRHRDRDRRDDSHDHERVNEGMIDDSTLGKGSLARDGDRDPYKDKERRDDDRSRYKDRDRRDEGRDRERRKDYVDIDRYVPSGGAHDDSKRARGRDRSR